MYERMLEKTVTPDFEDMAAVCGKSNSLFRSLDRYLEGERAFKREIRFPYGNSYGWSATYRKNKGLVCDVFAEKDAFTVMLRLSDEKYREAYPLLCQYTRECIDKKYPCGNGGWIHYRVTNEEQLGDIKRLLALK